jgi:hypothetical protein
MNSISSNPHTNYQLQGWPQNLAQNTDSAVSVEQVQNTSTPLQKLDYHKISFVNRSVETPTVAEFMSVSDIVVRLQSHPDVNLILKQLLDLDCQLISAKQRLSVDKDHVQQLEKQKFELLKSLDAKVDPLTFDFLDSFPITNKIRCLTWIQDATEQPGQLEEQDSSEDEQGILGPFANCILAKKMHVMMYNIPAGYSLQNALLNVDVGDNQCDMRWDGLNLPADRSSKVIVVVLPEIDATQVINGVKVMHFLDRS